MYLLLLLYLGFLTLRVSILLTPNLKRLRSPVMLASTNSTSPLVWPSLSSPNWAAAVSRSRGPGHHRRTTSGTSRPATSSPTSTSNTSRLLNIPRCLNWEKEIMFLTSSFCTEPRKTFSTPNFTQISRELLIDRTAVVSPGWTVLLLRNNKQHLWDSMDLEITC